MTTTAERTNHARVSMPARLVAMAALALAYFVAGRLGLSLAFVNASASAVWPPTGIALAAVLSVGAWVWPGIAIGAFLVNLTTSGSLLASIGIAAGNTIEALVAAHLVSRFANGTRAFDRAPDVVKYAVLAGLAAPVIAATIGVASLLGTGLTTTAEWPRVWLTWWLGDAGGAVAIAPALILLVASPARSLRGRALELVFLAAALWAVSTAIFGGGFAISQSNYALEYLVIPVLLWPAFRFGPRETALSVLGLSAIAVWGTLQGFGPFGREEPNVALLMVQTFAGVAAVTSATLAALVDERRRLNDQLESRIASRTDQLRAANDDLRAQIEAREHVEAELRASEARLLDAQAVAHVGSWEWDIATNDVWWSEELYRIYGMSRQSSRVTYQAFLERLHPDDRADLVALVTHSAETGEPYQVEHRIVRPDGTVRTLAARGRVLRDASGKTIRMLGTGQDITDRKRAEEHHRELLSEQAARRQAEEANRLKDQFLAMISHELRTPLNAVLGWTRMLATGSLDEPGRVKAVQVIERNAQAQARLIDDLLDVSRFVAGGVRLELRPTDIVPIVKAAIDAAEPSARLRHVHIEPKITSDSVDVTADSERLQQIVWNLVANAVKFTPEGGRVEVGLIEVPPNVELRVTDTGLGIDPAHLKTVFEPFWQADSTYTRAHGGLGLGLAIVRYLVEAHGGSVRAESLGEGQGASFVVSLPAAVLTTN
jgi:PAS domain S-box-containing protein